MLHSSASVVCVGRSTSLGSALNCVHGVTTMTLKRPANLWALAWGVCLFASMFSGQLRAEVPSLEDFSQHPEYTQAVISPKGTYLAVGVKHEGKRAVAVLELATMTPISLTGFYDRSEVGDFLWVNDDRLVLSIVRRRGALEAPGSLGELYAVNADGSAPKYLYGINADEPVFAGGLYLDTVDDRNIIIQSIPFSRRAGKDGLPEVIRVNVYSGRASRVVRSRLRGARFVADQEANPRIAYGINDEFDQVIHYLPKGSRDWVELRSPFEDDIEVLGFEEDGKTVVVSAATVEDKTVRGLYRLTLANGAYEQIYHAGDTDVSRAFWDEGHLYGTEVYRHYREFVPLDPAHPFSLLKQQIQRAFPAHTVTALSKTEDDQKIVIALSSPSDPPSFYLFDRDTRKLQFLLDAYPRIEGKTLGQNEGFSVVSRDGMTLHGYLTLPTQGEAPYPTIVMPHGGPHARDGWSYDDYVQVLATRGYAVLQVNFRGSTGFGYAFRDAGYGEWGRNTQHDIIDATQWAIAEGLADPDRIGIFGGSFGGYSALQAPLVAPEMFKAAIGYVGVYDLELLYNSGDIATTRWGDAYLDKTLPSDPEQLHAQSPAQRADELDLPIFIVHGEDDYRAAFEHAELMRDALIAGGKSFEWMVKKGEEHGFYDPANRLELFRRMLAFFDQHLVPQDLAMNERAN
jgi:dienelactone hydrolase